MKFLFSFLFFISLTVSSNAQNWLWAKSAIGSSTEEGFSVSADANGNVYATGEFYGFPITFGTFTLPNAGGGDVYLVKYDANGNVLWAKSAGGTGDEYGWSVSADAAGNAFVTGEFSSATITFGTFTLSNSGASDIFLVKYDPNGNVLWAKNAGGANADVGLGVSADAAGNSFVTGYFSSASITFGNTTLTNSGLQNVFIAKYDASGNELWAKSGIGTSSDEGLSLSADAAGNIFVTGYFNSPTIIFGSSTLTNAGISSNVFLVKYDANGNMMWAKSAGGTNGENGNSVSSDLAGNVFVTGCFSSSTITFGLTTLSNAGNRDVFVVKYDGAGNVLWAKCGGGPALDLGFSISADASGNAYVVGGFLSSAITFGTTILTPPPSTCFGSCDPAFIVKYDPNGNVLCASALASSGDDKNCISADPFGNAYLSGDFTANPFSLGVTNLTLTGAENIFVAKYSCGSTLSATATSTNVNCFGGCTGNATATPNGGTSPYTFAWTPSGGIAATATGLCAGTYTCTITDNASNTTTAIVTITQPTLLSATIIHTNENCNGGNNASATVNASGGTAPYTYVWNNSQTNSTATNLIAGTYNVIVTDANGCTTTQTITIAQPTPLIISSTSTNTSCGNGTGTATVNASGGTGPYTYLWNNFQSTITATGLSSGIYTVIITDANGCTQTATATVINANGPTAQINTSTNVLCNGGNSGSATASATGGTSPYTYLWNNSQTNAVATNLTVGTYTVIVTDANGCTSQQTIIITQPTAITINSTSTPDTCTQANGTASANATGGTGPYNYSWSNGSTLESITNLSGGTFTVIITDANGCTQTQTINVASFGGATANAGSDITITQGSSTILNGSGGVSYSWYPANSLSCITCTNPTAAPNVTTTYYVIVTNANGCSGIDSVTIFIDSPCNGKLLGTLMPNAFSPNSDGHNDRLCVPENSCISKFKLIIYDRWGEKIFESNNFNSCWDGNYKDKELNTAVFAYFLDVELSSGETMEFKGNISLIK